MSDRSGEAGPSRQHNGKKHKKRSANGSDGPAPKAARLAEVDDGHKLGGAGADPMEAMESAAAGGNGNDGDDPMAALEKAADPMEALDGETEAAQLPVRADEFEQEAEREVEASKGLDGAAAEEGKMKLVHQVRHQASHSSFWLYVSARH